MTRQRECQLRWVAKGLCQNCGKEPIHPRSKCLGIKCLIKVRERNRAKKGCKSQVKGGPGRPRIT